MNCPKSITMTSLKTLFFVVGAANLATPAAAPSNSFRTPAGVPWFGYKANELKATPKKD